MTAPNSLNPTQEARQLPPIKIVAAAIRWRGVVYTGVRHGHIIKDIVDLGQIDDGEHVGSDEQGFVDEFGIFRTRPMARLMAIKAGQVEPEHKTLYSEDLW